MPTAEIRLSRSKQTKRSSTGKRGRRSIARNGNGHGVAVAGIGNSAVLGVVNSEGKTTHVIVPAEEYERLVVLDMAREVVAQIERGDDEETVDADDFFAQLAAEEVVKARKAAGLTQKQLGKKVGMPQSQISRIERNPDRTTVRTIRKLAKALRVDVSAFIDYVSKK
ncbi:MAG: helix-turn-helix transcriptional regulator [Planctomycetota bacterium]